MWFTALIFGGLLALELINIKAMVERRRLSRQSRSGPRSLW